MVTLTAVICGSWLQSLVHVAVESSLKQELRVRQHLISRVVNAKPQTELCSLREMSTDDVIGMIDQFVAANPCPYVDDRDKERSFLLAMSVERTKQLEKLRRGQP